MKNLVLFGLLLTLALPTVAGGCQTVASVSFEQDLMPVLKRRCAACHITGEEPGKMALVPGKAYAYLVNVDSVESELKRIEPGDPDKSYLMHKLQGTHLDVGGNGVRMPLHQSPLPEKDIERIRLWIGQGAVNN